jgi:hypothetical protein
MNTKEPVLFTIRFPDIVGYRSAEYRAECEIEIQNDYAWQIAHEYETNNAAIPENVQNALDEYCGQNEDLDWSKYAYALRKMFASDVLYAILKDKNYPSNTKERFFPEWHAYEDSLYIDIPESAKPYLHEWVLAALEDGSDVISELAMFFFVIDNSPCGLPNEPEELAEYMEIDYVPYPDCSLQNASNLHNDYFTESVAKWIADNVSSELIEQCNSNKALLAELWNALIEAIEEESDD